MPSGSIIWRNSALLVRDIVAFDYRTMQDAAFRIHAVIGDGAVHRGPIVPHDEVARLPFVRIDELVLRTKVCQLIQKLSAFFHRFADDVRRVNTDIKYFFTRLRMSPY